MSAQEALYRTTASAVEQKRFFNELAFYEEDEHTGRLLAKIAHSQQVSPSIGALCMHTGRVTNSPDQIMSELVDYYSSLYASNQTYPLESLTDYLDTVRLPSMSDTSEGNWMPP